MSHGEISPQAQPAGQAPNLIRSLAAVSADRTGSETYERYQWQCKHAVHEWLQCLSNNGPVAIICEHVEDMVIVEVDVLRFVQMKTRDRGSWSAASVCADGRGLDALVRSYRVAKSAGLLGWSRFELYLEGPRAAQAETSGFFENPSVASNSIKAKLKAFGLSPAELRDFLGRLKIKADQPSRSTIDAVVIRVIGALWPALSMRDVEALYQALLSHAARAQSAESLTTIVRHGLHRLMSTSDGDWQGDFLEQVLHADTLKQLTPPLSQESDEDLLGRVGNGISALELKLIRAGASPRVKAQALTLRAESDVTRQLALAGGSVTTEDLEVLAERLLALANAVAGKIAFQGNYPAGLANAADYVASDLMSRPTELLATDGQNVFARDARMVYGYLCQLSDQCRFGWRAG